VVDHDRPAVGAVPFPAPPVDLPAHLRPVRPLGRGGSATVWLVRDRRRGDHVALKVLEGTVDVASLLGRVEREARALARLDGHPAVASIRACGADRHGRVWIATSFVVGPTLADRVRASEPLDGAEALEVFRALAAALADAHGVGVVHGDVSPANVVLGRAGPVLVDFGVGGVDAHVGERARTPVVAPPERLRGVRPRPAGDVWSAAATVRWATAPGAVLPESCRRLVHRCLSEVPADRPTAPALRSALGDGAAGLSSPRRSR